MDIIIYKTCNHCRGNGYITIFLGEGTVTCNECSGAGYFYPSKTNNETRTTDLNPNKESVSCQQP
jgi:DnaJ-class molecular chaperone